MRKPPFLLFDVTTVVVSQICFDPYVAEVACKLLLLHDLMITPRDVIHALDL